MSSSDGGSAKRDPQWLRDFREDSRSIFESALHYTPPRKPRDTTPQWLIDFRRTSQRKKDLG
jgi:hypothetical protein